MISESDPRQGSASWRVRKLYLRKIAALFVVVPRRCRARVSSLRGVSTCSQVVFLLFRSPDFKELEIVVLRHELAVSAVT